MNTLHISNLHKTSGKTRPGTATLICPYGIRTHTNAKRMREGQHRLRCTETDKTQAILVAKRMWEGRHRLRCTEMDKTQAILVAKRMREGRQRLRCTETDQTQAILVAKRMWEACGGLRGGLERREQNGGVQEEVAICGCFELFD